MCLIPPGVGGRWIMGVGLVSNTPQGVVAVLLVYVGCLTPVVLAGLLA